MKVFDYKFPKKYRLSFSKIGRNSKIDLRRPSYDARKNADFRHFQIKTAELNDLRADHVC